MDTAVHETDANTVSVLALVQRSDFVCHHPFSLPLTMLTSVSSCSTAKE